MLLHQFLINPLLRWPHQTNRDLLDVHIVNPPVIKSLGPYNTLQIACSASSITNQYRSSFRREKIHPVHSSSEHCQVFPGMLKINNVDLGKEK